MRAIQNNVVQSVVVIMSLSLAACSTTQHKTESTKVAVSDLNKDERNLFTEFFIKRTLAAGVPVAGKEVAKLLEESAIVLSAARGITKEAAIGMLLRDASKSLRAGRTEFKSLSELEAETFEDAQFKNFKEVMAEKYPSVYAFRASTEEAAAVSRTQQAASESRTSTQSLDAAKVEARANSAPLPEATTNIQKFYNMSPQGAKAAMKVYVRTGGMSLVTPRTCTQKYSETAVKNLTKMYVKQGEINDRFPEKMAQEEVRTCQAKVGGKGMVESVINDLNIPQGSVQSTVDGLGATCDVLADPLLLQHASALAGAYDQNGVRALEEARYPECAI